MIALPHMIASTPSENDAGLVLRCMCWFTHPEGNPHKQTFTYNVHVCTCVLKATTNNETLSLFYTTSVLRETSGGKGKPIWHYASSSQGFGSLEVCCFSITKMSLTVVSGNTTYNISTKIFGNNVGCEVKPLSYEDVIKTHCGRLSLSLSPASLYLLITHWIYWLGQMCYA